MRKSTSVCLILCLLAFTHCGPDSLSLPESPLSGKIEGDDWAYASANAYTIPSTNQIEATFISDGEFTSDPCALRIPGLSHVKALFRPGFGSFSVSPVAVDNNQIQVVFQVTNAKRLVANAGFFEVYDINERGIIGYLQASENATSTFVEGRVEIELCN